MGAHWRGGCKRANAQYVAVLCGERALARGNTPIVLRARSRAMLSRFIHRIFFFYARACARVRESLKTRAQNYPFLNIITRRKAHGMQSDHYP